MRAHKILLSLIAAIVGNAAIVASSAHAQGIPLLRDAEIEEFIDDYSNPVFKAAGLPEGSIEILLVNDLRFNAFAGGRYMGVNAGLLTIADTPAQVQAVIAHEAGHLAGGHSARSDEAIANATRPMLLSVILAAGAIAAGAPDAGLGLIALGQNVGVANFLNYSRGQEASADQASITYLNKIGRSSKGALELWRKMRNSQIIRGDKINPYMQTHPLANQRLNSLQQRAEQSPYYEVVDSPEEIYRLKMIQGKIRGFLSDPDDALRHYPLTDQSDEARYARAVAYYRNSQLDKALSEIRTLTGLYEDNPYFHELEGQMLFESGKVAEAAAPNRRAVSLKSDSALLRISLGRALLASNEPMDRGEAITEFKRALLLESDNSFGWFELARAYSADGNEMMANLATAESRYYAGANADANAFARRAIAGLKRGSPEWRQAADVIVATTPEGEAPRLPQNTPDIDHPAPSPPAQKSERPDVPDPTLTQSETL